MGQEAKGGKGANLAPEYLEAIGRREDRVRNLREFGGAREQMGNVRVGAHRTW